MAFEATVNDVTDCKTAHTHQALGICKWPSVTLVWSMHAHLSNIYQKRKPWCLTCPFYPVCIGHLGQTPTLNNRQGIADAPRQLTGNFQLKRNGAVNIAVFTSQLLLGPPQKLLQEYIHLKALHWLQCVVSFEEKVFQSSSNSDSTLVLLQH